MKGSDLDQEMFVAIPIFTIGAAATLGLIEGDALPFVDLGDVLIETGTVEWTLGRLLSLAALVGVFVNRDASITDTSAVDAWVVYATAGLIVAPPFFGSLEATLAETPAALVAFIVQTMGITIVSYLN